MAKIITFSRTFSGYHPKKGQPTYFVEKVFEIAENDGLTSDDLLAWFKYPKPFSGQIICWNHNIKY